jgi:predicted N-acetyltransferase YhbS
MSSISTSADGSVRVRIENIADDAERHAVRLTHETAFGGVEEADLVDQLRSHHSLNSLVAERDSGIVGHALFSRMWIQTSTDRVSAVALAPVAVRPECQRRGIGSAFRATWHPSSSPRSRARCSWHWSSPRVPWTAFKE